MHRLENPTWRNLEPDFAHWEIGATESDSSMNLCPIVCKEGTTMIVAAMATATPNPY